MGVSTNGILVFGIDLGEELPEFLEDYSEDGDTWWDFTDSISGETDYAKRNEFRDNHIADLVSYCSYEYPMYILAVNGTETVVRRGDVREIIPSELSVSQEKVDKLKAFCEEYDIEWKEPRWLLASMWN